VVIVNDAFVRQYSRDRDALGRLMKLGGPSVPAVQIVGVVGAVQQLSTFGNLGPIAAVPGAYVPATQFGQFGDGLVVVAHTWFQPSWIVRTNGPGAIASSMQRALREIDPRLTFNKFRTIEDVQSEAMATSRVQALLLAALAGVALTLCVAGVYGVVANSVVERRRELGVRMALGATPLQTLTTAAAGGVGLAVCGTAVGLLLSLPVTGIMRQLVFDVSVNDPLTLAVAAGIVVMAASSAAIVPALRTLRLNVTSILNNR
jgi:hypothetical protein